MKSFLGIELNTSTMQARLPRDELVRLGQELALWQDKKILYAEGVGAPNWSTPVCL